MSKLFKSVTNKEDDGWLQASFGNSSIDNQDYVLTTHCLHGDMVPDAMTDAKTASELVAGLLNAFYNSVDVSGMDEAMVREMGVIAPVTAPEPPKDLPF